MDDARRATPRLEHLMVGISANVDFGIVKNVAKSLYLVHDGRCLFVGNTKHYSRPCGVNVLRAAQGIDAGAGRIGDAHAVDEVAVPVMQGMKRHVVEDTMRHDDQMARLQLRGNRRKQLLIEFLEMRHRAAKERRLHYSNM